MSREIGSIIKIKEDITVRSVMNLEDRVIKAGTTAVVNSDGDLYILTGREQNTIISKRLEVYGYDHESIAKCIFSRLNVEFNLLDILEENDIEVNDFKEMIEGVLESIL